MQGFLKPQWSLVMCQDVCESNRFPTVSFGTMTSGEMPLGKRKMTAVYLYTTAVKKPFIRTYNQRTRAGSQKPSEPISYDRFHLFGIPNSAHVIIIFSATEAMSRSFLRFGSHIQPGTEVFILMPSVKGAIHNTPIVATNDPFVPVRQETQMDQNILPPTNVDLPGYVFFDFVTRDIALEMATATSGVCRGVLCDGQSGLDSCGCTFSPARKRWALSLKFTAPEFMDIANDTVQITSFMATTVFVSPDVYNLPVSDPCHIPADLDDAVSSISL